MLGRAVRELRGEPAEPEVEPEIQLGIPAYIPESYIADVSQRLVVYKRLAGIRAPDELEGIAEELAERYGPRPTRVETLLRLMDLRRVLKELRVVRARRRREGVVLEFEPRAARPPIEVRLTASDPDAMIVELGTHLQRLAAA